MSRHVHDRSRAARYPSPQSSSHLTAPRGTVSHFSRIIASPLYLEPANSVCFVGRWTEVFDTRPRSASSRADFVCQRFRLEHVGACASGAETGRKEASVRLLVLVPRVPGVARRVIPFHNKTDKQFAFSRRAFWTRVDNSYLLDWRRCLVRKMETAGFTYGLQGRKSTGYCN